MTTDSHRQDSDLAVELHDVFHVLQVTRDTDLEADVGVDFVDMETEQTSQVHRHNFSETVLYFVEGEAIVECADVDYPVVAGDRLRIAKGEFHGVRTHGSTCRFLSVQTPPILNKTTGFRDLEPRE
jgi:mannose-6-phosphate isomerase-like protein (cupin superfamily)